MAQAFCPNYFLSQSTHSVFPHRYRIKCPHRCRHTFKKDTENTDTHKKDTENTQTFKKHTENTQTFKKHTENTDKSKTLSCTCPCPKRRRRPTARNRHLLKRRRRRPTARNRHLPAAATSRRVSCRVSRTTTIHGTCSMKTKAHFRSVTCRDVLRRNATEATVRSTHGSAKKPKMPPPPLPSPCRHHRRHASPPFSAPACLIAITVHADTPPSIAATVVTTHSKRLPKNRKA